MCGRFNLTRPKDIVARFGFMDWSDKRIEPRFNIAPSQEILTIVQLPLEAPVLQTAVWGLKPEWLNKGSKRPPPINVRAESLNGPLYAEARRCLIPATGFYEWRGRQPMHIQLSDGEPFAFAGLWLPPASEGAVPTAAIVTTRPNELMSTIHNRMPAILRPQDELVWLDPSTTTSEAKELAERLVDSEVMEAYPVKPLVNSWENEGPELIEPVDPVPQETQIGLPL